MATSGAQEIKKQEALVSFSIISYKTRLRVIGDVYKKCVNKSQTPSRLNQSKYVLRRNF